MTFDEYQTRLKHLTMFLNALHKTDAENSNYLPLFFL